MELLTKTDRSFFFGQAGRLVIEEKTELHGGFFRNSKIREIPEVEGWSC